MKFRQIFFILPVLCLFFAACGGSAIGDAQEFSPNEPPSIISVKAVNFDGTEITQLDIEPYKQFKLIIEAVDPDNNPLEYKFDSESGTFAGISSNPNGCTAVFKTGSVKGGQNIELWAGVSDGNGAIVRQSFNLGTGKLGPAITASFEKIRFRPVDKIKLSVSANCSGFFQLYCDGTSNFNFEKDMYRYSYSENKTTDFILAGPNCTSYADITLEAKPGCVSDTDYESAVYNLVLVFRDGLFQENTYKQTITVDGMPPKIDTFSPNSTGASTDPAVTVTFTEDIGYAASSSLKLSPDDGTVKLKSINGAKAIFSVSGLETSRKYTATVSGIKDIAGNEMIPDSSKSFTTGSDSNTKLIVTDSNGNNDYTAYCGFENFEFQLLAQDEEGNTASGISYSSNNAALVDVSSTGLLTVNTKNFNPTNESDNVVTITATTNTGYSADYTVTIKYWYPIYEESGLVDLSKINLNLNGRFKLMENINVELVNSGNIITPIGSFINASNNSPFTGIFDGNDKTLSNFKIEASSNNAGLFAYNTGTIKNLKVNYAEFNGNSRDYVGIICGRNGGTISNCHLSEISIIAKDYVGGIAGINTGTIENCTVSTDGNEINSGGSYTGGLVGDAVGGLIKKCSTACTVKSNSNAGGLIGFITGVNENVNIEDCYSSGTVTGSSQVGGLIGYAKKVNISITEEDKVYADCEVSGTNNVGGLIGYCDVVTIIGLNTKAIYSKGTVKGNDFVGGLIGFVFNSLNAEYCYSLSDVSVNTSGTQCFGGLIGRLKNSTIQNCFSTGTVDAVSANSVGGLIGSDDSDSLLTVQNCYHETGSVTGKDNAGGLIGIAGKAEITGNTYANCDVEGINYVGGLIGKYNMSGKLEIKGTTDVKIYSKGAVTGDSYVGGLVGYAIEVSTGSTLISYCSSESAVTGNQNVGGLIGYMDGNSISLSSQAFKVTNSYSSGAVKGNTSVGGLAGIVNFAAKIISCYSISDVSLKESSTPSPQFFGGLIGYCSVSAVEDSYSKGNVSVNISAGSNIGGLIGGINLNSGSSSVLKCFHSNGKVTGKDYVGGLIGLIYPGDVSNKATIEQCFANCEVNAGNSCAGGLIGQINNTEFLNCYSRGKVTGNNFIGGLIGSGTGTSKIKYCYAAYSEDDLEGNSLVGGLVGGGTIDDITSTFYSGTTNGYGQNVGIDNLKSISTYTSSADPLLKWSIGIEDVTSVSTTWLISSQNDGFPILTQNPPR